MGQFGGWSVSESSSVGALAGPGGDSRENWLLGGFLHPVLVSSVLLWLGLGSGIQRVESLSRKRRFGGSQCSQPDACPLGELPQHTHCNAGQLSTVLELSWAEFSRFKIILLHLGRPGGTQNAGLGLPSYSCVPLGPQSRNRSAPHPRPNMRTQPRNAQTMDTGSEDRHKATQEERPTGAPRQVAGR